jgi:hypothetical protein
MRIRPPYPSVTHDPAELGYARTIERYLLELRAFYHWRATWQRLFYRASGILVVLVGAALPLLTALSYAHKQLVVSLAGVVVAAVTALRAFYRWDQAWILLRNTERTITGAWWEYQARLDTIPPDRDETTARRERHEAARALAALLVQIRQEEADVFFKDMAFPSGKEGA